jgi:hypothetical protein
LKGRRLASFDPSVHLFTDYQGVAEEWARSVEASVGALRADHDAVAVDWAHDLFDRVFDAQLDSVVIRDWQQKLLERRF